MTTSKKAMQKKIIAQLGMMDIRGLRTILDLIKSETDGLVGNYKLFARSVFINRTRGLSDKPMPSVFKDAIDEAFSIMVSPEEAKEIKKLALRYEQPYKPEEAVAWARQFMLVYRTKIFNHYDHSSICKICGVNSLHEVIMLQVSLQAGPFCKKCLRRIPKSWYCQE
jgi:hypothetical protein